MKNKNQIVELLFRWVLPLVVLAAAVAVVIMLGSKPRVKRKKAPPRVAIAVEIVHAREHDGRLSISASGVVAPFREVDVAAEVSGRVVWKSESLLPGKFVTKGDELLKIDPVDYELEFSRLEQQLEKARSDLESVEVDKQNANLLIDLAKESLTLRTRELDRVKTLKQSGATSESEFDEAERSFLESRQLLTAQENLLRGLEAERKSLVTAQLLAAIGLEKAKLDRRRTTILAPFSGVVISQLAEANSHVQAGDNIAKIEDTSKVEVRCSLRKEDLEFLPAIEATATDLPADAYRLPPVPVTVQYTRSGRNYVWDGVLSRQDGLGMDERTRTMPVRILVDDPLGCRVDSQDTASRPIALVRGMFVQVELHCRPDRPLLTIPEETIRPGKTVWIMENEQLKIKPIHIARIEDSVAYVDARRGSLSREHAIISSPVPGARQGLAVTINAPRKAGLKKGGPQGPNKGGGRKRAGKPASSTAEKSDKSSMRSPRSDASALVSDESKIQ